MSIGEQKLVKVALVNPPLLKGFFRHQPYLPIGLAYLAAVLEQKGHEVKVNDCQALDIDHEKLKSEISSFKPDLVGITSIAPLIRSSLLSAKAAKEASPNVTVILGGPHATFMDQQIIEEETAVDVIVRGEGEETLLDLVDNVNNPKKLESINGVTFRSNNQTVRTPNRPFIQNLDQLPKPVYNYFQLEKYRLFGKKVLPVITSRGCPFQ